MLPSVSRLLGLILDIQYNGSDMSSRKTSVIIDEDLLSAAQKALETSTIRETIEQAFLEVLRARARAEEVAALAARKGMDLGDEGVMSKAWRH